MESAEERKFADTKRGLGSTPQGVRRMASSVVRKISQFAEVGRQNRAVGSRESHRRSRSNSRTRILATPQRDFIHSRCADRQGKIRMVAADLRSSERTGNHLRVS